MGGPTPDGKRTWAAPDSRGWAEGYAADLNRRLEQVVCRAVQLVGHGDRAVAWVAARQHGIVSATQARGCGLGRAAVAGRIERGGWAVLQRRVYFVGVTRPAREAHLLAAALRCRGVVSHLAAAWLWRVLDQLPAELDLTVVDGRNPGTLRGGVRVHRRQAAMLGPARWRGAVPVTSVVDTLVDCGSVLAENELEAACAIAIDRRLTTLDGLRAAAGRAAGRPGVAGLREVVTGLAQPRRTGSVNERLMLGLVRDAGLPEPETNAVVCGKELDLYWPSARLGVEVDAFATHGGRRSFEDDRRVDADLGAAGVAILRFTGHRIRTKPVHVVARLSAVLTLRLGGLPVPRRR